MSSGVTMGQLVAFLLTIVASVVASYFAARFGAKESRRQYQEKADIDKRQAAAELTHPLMAFAFECERRKFDISLHASSKGLAGQEHGLRDLSLPAECNRHAAVLGGDVGARVLKIQVLKTRIDNAIGADFEVGCPVDEDGPEKVSSWLSLLELRARYAADLAAKAAGLPVSHFEHEFETLRKDALRYAHEINSGDEDRWPAPSICKS